ncbi:MAG: hydroxymethylbilane synthase [Opitutales bacterium]|nr:hydroxymethylbilane synthase [Opitutales bacterium]MCH8539560.1 hydroxymethylbilane synthase [Opitutales bacterium]
MSDSSFPPVLLATRRSALALRQTELVQAHLQQVVVEPLTFEVLPMTTQGDQQLSWSLSKEGGKGLFTSELEKALLKGEADLAVHSAKDLPTEMPAGLVLAGFLPREKAHDVLIVREGLTAPATVATGSPRRRTQLQKKFPRANFQEFRGNVETRLRKIAAGEAEATVMAAAGLRRLGIEAWEGLSFTPLSLREMVPAPGQGAVAIQCRKQDLEKWAPCFHGETARAVEVERTFLDLLGGGCHSAIAAHLCSDNLLYLYSEAEGFLEINWQPREGETLRETLLRLVPWDSLCRETRK